MLKFRTLNPLCGKAQLCGYLKLLILYVIKITSKTYYRLMYGSVVVWHPAIESKSLYYLTDPQYLVSFFYKGVLLFQLAIIQNATNKLCCYKIRKHCSPVADD